MRIPYVVLAASLLGHATALEAQCTGSPSVQAICNRAIDAMKTFHPVAGIVVSGGNPQLGSAKALGGLGHVFVSARLNATKAIVPNPDTASGGATVEGLVPAPVVEAGIGVWPGLRGGFLAVDALFSATLLPTHAIDKLRVDSNAAHFGSLALGIGYGARVSAWRGVFPIPAVSLTVMRRTLPRIAYGQLAASSVSAGDAFEFDVDLHATNVRLAASYRLPFVDVAAGIGTDSYTSDGHLQYYDNPPLNSVATVTFRPRNTRQVLFIDAATKFSVLSLGAELGYQTGKDQNLSTAYPFNAKDGHVFWSVGLRVGL